MRKDIMTVAVLLLLAGCGKSEGDKAQQMLEDIVSLYENGEYQSALDSIKVLRDRFPEAIEQRRAALKVWQDASLKQTQNDIAVTDSALQAVTRLMQSASDIATRNRLGVVRDSLQVRYETLCGMVRVIRKRQETTAK